MIVRLSSCGKSFKGLSAYLTHDPDAETDKRVAWTHTHNLADDHVPAAVNEMYQTAQNAELLKQEAGIRGGGRATQNTAKHFSLNWAPGETPSREHMIDTTKDFLQHMGWQDHQAIFVAHNDKLFSHCHVLLNVVNPETGLRLSEDFEKRRAQRWALEYEREHGLHCEQRLKAERDREASATRPAWTAFNEQKKIFENEENQRRANSEKNRENGKIANLDNWKNLKGIQRDEREAFFADGKSQFSDLRKSIYRETREEFRGRWSNYFSALRAGHEDLADVKTAILANQKSTLESRRDSACAELRKSRDDEYRSLLDGQKDARASLRAWQTEGRDTAEFFRNLDHLKAGSNTGRKFQEAARETTEHQTGESEETGSTRLVSPAAAASAANTTVDTGVSAGLGLASGPLSILGRLFAEFVNGPPAANQNREEDPNPFAASAEEARRHTEREGQKRRDDEMEERQRVRARD